MRRVLSRLGMGKAGSKSMRFSGRSSKTPCPSQERMDTSIVSVPVKSNVLFGRKPPEAFPSTVSHEPRVNLPWKVGGTDSGRVKNPSSKTHAGSPGFHELADEAR